VGLHRRAFEQRHGTRRKKRL